MNDDNIISIIKSGIDCLGDENDLLAVVRNTSEKTIVLFIHSYCDICGEYIYTDGHLLAPDAIFYLSAEKSGWRLLKALESGDYEVLDDIDDMVKCTVEHILDVVSKVNNCVNPCDNKYCSCELE